LPKTTAGDRVDRVVTSHVLPSEHGNLVDLRTSGTLGGWNAIECSREKGGSLVSDWNHAIIEEFRSNDGIVGGMFEGKPLLLLHSVGARTGKEHVNPLMYLDLDGHRYVFASKAGADSAPDWYYNLVANPGATVEVGTDKQEVTAKPVEGPERDRIYAEQSRQFPQFAEYQEKTKRLIPVVELTAKS
jgi:deazaflavin-dependent oxidoreductase (nitroreductase family)